MKRYPYHELLEIAGDPYRGFIKNEEPYPRHTGEEYDAAVNELSALGYTLYVHTGGELEKEFLILSLEECHRSLENKKALPDLIYCDEDARTDVNRGEKRVPGGIFLTEEKPPAGARINPFFKPDFSPDTLGSFFYIGGAFLIRESSDEFLHGFSVMDFCSVAKKILGVFLNDFRSYNAVHIRSVLYHSITDRDYKYPDGHMPRVFSEASAVDAAARIVILSKNNSVMLLDCIDSLKRSCDVETGITVVDNGSDAAVKEFLEGELEKRGVSYIYAPMDFVYSALCNRGAREGSEPYVIFLNDDVTVPEGTTGFPSSLIGMASREHVGAVGVKLLYPGGKRLIQHIGITLLKDGPSHKLCTYPDDPVYEKGRNRGCWDVLAVTGACLVVSREKFNRVGGFDERLRVSYTDVDLCSDLRESGLYNVVVNECFLFHHESVSRGRDDMDDEKIGRLKKEREIFYKKHPVLYGCGDPFYSTNLTSTRLDYSAEFLFPWEGRIVDCPLMDELEGEKKYFGFTALPEGRMLYSIDRIELIPPLFEDTQSCYEIEGWSIMKGRDMSAFEPAVEIDTGLGRKCFCARRTYREDLGNVFPAEKNVLLSGFVCRVRAEEISGQLTKERVAPLLIKDGFFGIRIYRNRE